MQFLIISIFVLLGAVSNSESKEVVCYVPTYALDGFTSVVDTTLCSQFIIAFGTLQANGAVTLPANFQSYKRLRTSTSKLILALGGQGSLPAVFQQIAATTSTRATFAQNCLNLVKNNGLDGIDIDWEFPGTADRATFVALHKDLKAILGSAYQVSTAVSVGQWLVKTNNVYDISGLAAAVDQINLMAYDMHMDQQWDVSSGVYYNAPLTASFGDSVTQGVNFFLQGGAPASKLMVGVPFYGRQYQLANAAQNTPQSAFISGHQGSGSIPSYTPNYSDFCQRLTDSSWTKKFDSNTQVPYMYNGNLWLSYDDANSIGIKSKLANSLNLGGVMVWSINQDDYQGSCGTKWVLLKAINAAISRSNNNVVPGPTTKPIVTTTQKGVVTTQGSNTATCTAANQLLSNKADCTKYFVCVSAGATPTPMSCGAGLFWNKNGYCDWTCNN